jgi:ABC-type phosphate transport system substrate-binding protein
MLGKKFRGVTAFAVSLTMLTGLSVLAGVGPAGAVGAYSASKVLANSYLETAAAPITLGGSSFDAPLLNAAVTQYKSLGANNSGTLTSAYASNSSGTGRANMINGTYTLGFTDVPLNYAGQDTSDTTGYLQAPVALGGVAIIYNIGFKSSWTANDGDYTQDPTTHKWSYTPGTGTNGAAIASGSTVKSGTNVAATALTDNNVPYQGVATPINTVCANLLSKHGLQLSGNTLARIFAQGQGAADGIASWGNSNVLADNPKLTVHVAIPVTGPYTKSNKAGTTVAQKNGSATINCLQNLTTESITSYSRKSGSGTTFMFQDYLSKVDSADFPYPTSNNMNGGSYPGAGSSADLATAVNGKDGSVSYVEYGYALLNDLTTARLQSDAGSNSKWLKLNAGTVTQAAVNGLTAINANSACTSGFDFNGPATYNASTVNTQCFSITAVNAQNAYPIAGFSYVAMPKVGTANAATGTTLTNAVRFLIWMTQSGAGTSADTTTGQNLAGGQGYVKLPKAISSDSFKKICGSATGTGSTTFSGGAFSSICNSIGGGN